MCVKKIIQKRVDEQWHERKKIDVQDDRAK
jgi:hypothetical protein